MPPLSNFTIDAPRGTYEAAGVTAVRVSLQRGLQQMGPLRTAAALSKLNQRHGFDCPGCAWPEEHGGRKLAEFCENGAKAVAEEATKRRVTPDFFARHSPDIDSIGSLAIQREFPCQVCMNPRTYGRSSNDATMPVGA